MFLSHIVAASENGIIGQTGKMPWHIPEDFKYFKAVTTGHAMIMGRKTYESIGRPLPGRLNLVVSRNPDFRAPGAVVLPTFEAAFDYATERAAEWGDEVFVIGGGEIYRQTMALVDRIYMTRVHREIEGDASYPAIDSSLFAVSRTEPGVGALPFTWTTYDRKSKSF